MPPRFFVPPPLRAGDVRTLPPGPARHVQVLRLQPGDDITLFDGGGGEWHACIDRIGRSEVSVHLIEHVDTTCELPFDVTLAMGMPANDRMDNVVEKATELGVAGIQPLVCERSVLRLVGDRADKKVAHWQAVAASASEQCGRTQVPTVHPVRTIAQWLASLSPDPTQIRQLLSLREDRRWNPIATAGQHLLYLSGPEGGLSEAEEQSAMQAGFQPASLGPRVLRADTAPLAVLAALALQPNTL
ncbi:MAG: 16S rRNA (uracil(1498)-N(3))-methyltransferase [Burkholderiaceae bacterium]|nr:16S rRNA (uracil(1498)-N(3))-methyltransferase [Burkholderiaceae bacterium]